MMWNVSHSALEVLHDRAHEARNAVELVDVQRVPRDLRVTLQVRFALLSEGIHRHVPFLQCAARRVGDDLRPGLIRLTQRHRIGMPRSPVASQRFVRQFGDVRSAHHHRHPGGANGIRHPVSLRDHAGHRADPHQPDALGEHETHDLGIAHRLRVAVDQQHFVSRRRKRLEEKHPEVRHEVRGHAVVGIVEQNSH